MFRIFPLGPPVDAVDPKTGCNQREKVQNIGIKRKMIKIISLMIFVMFLIVFPGWNQRGMVQFIGIKQKLWFL